MRTFWFRARPAAKWGSREAAAGPIWITCSLKAGWEPEKLILLQDQVCCSEDIIITWSVQVVMIMIIVPVIRVEHLLCVSVSAKHFMRISPRTLSMTLGVR